MCCIVTRLLEDTIIARTTMGQYMQRNIIMISMDRAGITMEVRQRWRNMNMELAVLTIITLTTITISIISTNMMSTNIHIKAVATFLKLTTNINITKDAVTPTFKPTAHNKPQPACPTKSAPTPQHPTNK
jgi:hypothetical protein